MKLSCSKLTFVLSITTLKKIFQVSSIYYLSNLIYFKMCIYYYASPSLYCFIILLFSLLFLFDSGCCCFGGELSSENKTYCFAPFTFIFFFISSHKYNFFFVWNFILLSFDIVMFIMHQISNSLGNKWILKFSFENYWISKSSLRNHQILKSG